MIGEVINCFINSHEYSPDATHIWFLLILEGPRIFQCKNGQNYPLLKNILGIIFLVTFYCL